MEKTQLTESRKLSVASESSIEIDANKLIALIEGDAYSEAKEIQITRTLLSKLSENTNLTEEELDVIFSALDSDGDGVITSTELREKILSGDCIQSRLTYCEADDAIAELGVELSLLDSACQEQVCELYQQLHHAGNGELLEMYESVILGVLKELRQQQVENDRLEKSFKKEKELHERHMRQMEEEMEVQMQRIEERVRQREEERKESEKAEMKQKVQEEIIMLQQRLQQDGSDIRNKEIEEQLLHLKGKVEEMTFANRQLKSELTDAQTNLALSKSDLTAVKQQLNDKIHELEMDKDALTEFHREQENLTRQLHLLHDANKRLHDTNDDLRESMEVIRRASPIRQQSIMSNSGVHSNAPDYRRGSLMSEYFQSTPLIRNRMGSQSSLVEEREQNSVNVQSLTRYSPRMVSIKLSRLDTCETDGGILEDIDSGHSTLRDGPNDNDFDNEAFLNDAETLQRIIAEKQMTPNIRRSQHPPLMEDIDSHDEVETESELHAEPAEMKLSRNAVDQRRVGSSSSRSSSTRSSKSREGSLGRINKRQSLLPTDANKATMARVNKDPDRMYKVVLAGDAAVGKSSLIMRLCKGKFFDNLSSTLGVDFQTKMIELDGRTVALQLWDTAGQERFRSIAKSYFRRADGVLLLYDCTYERSFMSIREWMESIEDGALKKLPIMLCGNKMDMRPTAEQQGYRVVTFDDGQRLAREYGALFIETSAKDGTNISECIGELSRLMRANEDLEVKTAGLQLHDKFIEKNGCCSR